MGKLEDILIREGSITNNCPECYNQELRVRFFQKQSQNLFFHSISKSTHYSMDCLKCGSQLYPVSWTDDIERSFNYYQKTVVAQKAKVKPRTAFYVLVLVLLLLSGGLAYYFDVFA
ncbi:hypothetical protein [Sediminicola luteus]|uniref:Uncharacterized protein n=1 Tax=Sediminicola luteus TaxID=319238 RepID=A0A2A4G456_9FLAO|nr:hypothetical protein [Sediminicola luteus]PCE62758.1 hypothetical protein B7P33_15835 [Sediminicola luteus]